MPLDIQGYNDAFKAFTDFATSLGRVANGMMN